MKKTLVAIAVAAFAATSANAATVYEKDGTKVDINGSVRLMLNKKTDNRTDLQNDGSRFKFKFSQQLGEGLSALGYMELRPSGDDFDSNIKTNKVYAGFTQDNVGTLTFGKRLTAGDNFKLADPTEQFLSVVTATDLKTSSSKVVDFTSANFNGFGFQTSYVFGDDATKKDNPNQNGYQVLASYENDFDGLGIAAHALYSNVKHELNSNKTYNHKVWGLAAAVNYAGLGFAVDYAQAKVSDKRSFGFQLDGNEPPKPTKLTPPGLDINKSKAWQIATTYQVNDPLDVYVAYHQFKFENESGKKDAKVKGFAIGSHYNLTQNVKTYVEYTSEKGNWDKAKRENAYYAGLRVYF